MLAGRSVRESRGDATTFSCRDLTAFIRLDDLGLEVTGQLMEPEGAVLAAHSKLS